MEYLEKQEYQEKIYLVHKIWFIRPATVDHYDRHKVLPVLAFVLSSRVFSQTSPAPTSPTHIRHGLVNWQFHGKE